MNQLRLNISVDSAANQSMDLISLPLELSAINFGIRGLDDSSVVLEGHLRDISYNHYSVIDGIVAGNHNVPSNASIGEEAFSDYRVHYLTSDAFQTLRYQLPIRSVSFGFIPEDLMEDRVILDVDGGEFGSIQLSTHFDFFVLHVTNNPDNDAQSQTSSLNISYTSGQWIHAVVMVNMDERRVEWSLNSESARPVPFTSGFDPQELTSMSIGGAPALRLQVLSRQPDMQKLKGYRGCVQRLMVNNDTVELTPLAGLDGAPGPTSGITDECLVCRVRTDWCRNDGVCFNRPSMQFACDCFGTEFSGPQCADRKFCIVFLLVLRSAFVFLPTVLMFNQNGNGNRAPRPIIGPLIILHKRNFLHYRMELYMSLIQALVKEHILEYE